MFTCPKCRKKIFEQIQFYATLKNVAKVKELHEYYRKVIHRGKWKKESPVTVYCVLPEFGEKRICPKCYSLTFENICPDCLVPTRTNSICGYNLNRQELLLFHNSYKGNTAHQNISKQYWDMRSRKFPEKLAASIVESRTGGEYKASTILRIVHSRN